MLVGGDIFVIALTGPGRHMLGHTLWIIKRYDFSVIPKIYRLAEKNVFDAGLFCSFVVLAVHCSKLHSRNL